MPFVSNERLRQCFFLIQAYTNPELLCFAWLEKASSYLQSSAKEEYKTHGPGNVRVKTALQKIFFFPLFSTGEDTAVCVCVSACVCVRVRVGY